MTEFDGIDLLLMKYAGIFRRPFSIYGVTMTTDELKEALKKYIESVNRMKRNMKKTACTEKPRLLLKKAKATSHLTRCFFYSTSLMHRVDNYVRAKEVPTYSGFPWFHCGFIQTPFFSDSGIRSFFMSFISF